MQRYRIVLSDLDGTLLNEKAALPEQTREAIKALTGRGIPFVPISARPPASILRVLEELGDSLTAVVAAGGALLCDGAGAVLESHPIPTETALAVTEYADTRFPGITATICETNNWMAETVDNIWVETEIQEGGMLPILRDIGAYLKAGGSLHKFLFMGEPREVERLTLELGERFSQLNVLRSRDCYLEVMDAAASKSAGLRRVCRHFGVEPHDAVAFGDNYNDVDMLEAAGLGVAMGNAPEDVKARADRIALTNREEGLLQVLRELFPLN